MQCSWEIKGVHYVTKKLITRVLLDFFEISYCFWTRNQGSTWNISVFCLPDIGKIDIILHKFPQHWLEWAGERNLGFPSSSCRTLEPQTCIKGLLDKDPLQLFCFCFLHLGQWVRGGGKNEGMQTSCPLSPMTSFLPHVGVQRAPTPCALRQPFGHPGPTPTGLS